MNPVPQLNKAADLPGHMKVRLFYQTWDPRHVRSQVLRTEMSMQPPFIEDVCVLLPVHEITNDLAAFQPIFRDLQAAGVLAAGDNLRTFELRDEDVSTLAYHRA